MKRIVIIMLVLYLGGLMVSGGAGIAIPQKTERQSAAEIIEKALSTGGLENARRVIADMKQAPAGSYAFIEKEFIDLGNRLAGKKRYDDAIGIFLLSMDIFPDSADVLYHLAGAYRASGDEQSFYLYFRRMITLRSRLQLRDYLEKNEGKLLTSADEVIDKHLEATGGRKAWQEIRTMVIKFSCHDTSGNRGILVRHYKKPGFYRQGVEGSDQFTATDGSKTWRVRNGTWTEMDDQAYRRMGSLDNSFLDYESRGITYDLVGVEILNYAPVYHLKRTFWDAYQEDLYFSIDSGYLTETLTPYNIGPTYFTLWDYRKVEKVWIPHVQIRNMDSMGPPHGIVVREVQINVPLENSFFRPPEK